MSRRGGLFIKSTLSVGRSVSVYQYGGLAYMPLVTNTPINMGGWVGRNDVHKYCVLHEPINKYRFPSNKCH